MTPFLETLLGYGLASSRRQAARVITSLIAVGCPVSAAVAGQSELPIRGVVRAVNQAALSTDISMRIARLPFREGERFKASDVLVEFDCRRQKAEFEAMRGALREAQLNVASSLSLESFKAIGRNDLEIAKARLSKAKGEMASLEARVEDCKVIAPFSGRIADSPLRTLEFTTPQRPYLSIVGDAENEIEMIVPSSLVAVVAIGQSFVFLVDELPDEKVHATVSSIGAVVDPVSKTLKLLGSVTSAPTGLTAGMSGSARFTARGN